jgi:hypothetical protein
MIGQAIGALIAGAVAAWLAPGRTVGVMAIMSVLITFVLVRGLRRSAPGGAAAGSAAAVRRTGGGARRRARR